MMVVNMVENEEDLNYPANKTHRILKENQIHGSVELVVTLGGDRYRWKGVEITLRAPVSKVLRELQLDTGMYFASAIPLQ